MTDDHWIVLGVTPPRAEWFRMVSRWATGAAIPIDFVKCMSAAEAHARLHGGRAFSAVLVGSGTPGVDRDLVDAARAAGAVTIAVGDRRGPDWQALGAAAVLDDPFEPADLLGTLRQHATPTARLRSTIADPTEPSVPSSWRGRLVAVTGAGGTGTSITAAALADADAADPGNRGPVLLADLALQADQAMLHDTRSVVPGLSELVEAHRTARLPAGEIRRLTFAVPPRRYDLLLGLRRPRDWTALRPLAVAAALDGLTSTYRLIVADVDADVEGQRETGSLDVEERNILARTTLRRADVVVVTADSDTRGVHRLARVVRDLLELGLEPERLVPVLTRASRSRRRRAELTRAVASLLAGPRVAQVANPVHVPRRSEVEGAVRDATRLPAALTRSLAAEVSRRLDELDPTAASDEPVLIEPGTLGAWSGEPA